jgi:hypothetical protein
MNFLRFKHFLAIFNWLRLNSTWQTRGSLWLASGVDWAAECATDRALTGLWPDPDLAENQGSENKSEGEAHRRVTDGEVLRLRHGRRRLSGDRWCRRYGRRGAGCHGESSGAFSFVSPFLQWRQEPTGAEPSAGEIRASSMRIKYCTIGGRKNMRMCAR